MSFQLDFLSAINKHNIMRFIILRSRVWIVISYETIQTRLLFVGASHASEVCNVASVSTNTCKVYTRV